MDMYVKSGFIQYASNLFAGIKVRDVISWTVMILGSVLHACSTAGMVEEGWLCFNRIRSPKVTHHALMVSALARAGLFDEARIFIQEYHMERYPEVLRALLEGCRIHVQVKTGKRVIEQLCELKPLSAENCDVSCPRSEGIFWELQSLMKKMEGDSLRPKPDFSLHYVDEERKWTQIGHSEILALSFGLINTQVGATIHVTKNLRIFGSSVHIDSLFIQASKLQNLKG
ncbi:pentatricopeptide repeat-containing protein At5g15340, mitochondrial-like [Citrus sinensis]|uniref:pentatricopeptide repeat-containing protein At5g15340, mitochondrial n=1 Tax=Citrus clementina TaxID=85681 RepID=UPI000CED5A17|nr:pentatricopeptide repeat-containing protein At5g15340, mitochondrial [Citrus x clementina]XP_052288640.1 pentatricopeptide repeat-containing protein At5g15340, mitochondrial-like [Citrus sinensis]